MNDDILQVVKSQVSSIEGLWKSKKLALVVVFVTACIAFVAQGIGGTAPLWCAAIVVSAYVFAQGATEFIAARESSRVVLVQLRERVLQLEDELRKKPVEPST